MRRWDYCFIKNEYPKGFGALEDCPNKINAKHLTPVALPLLDWKEGHKTNQKIKIFFMQDTAFRVGSVGKKKKKMALCVWAISHNARTAWR